MFPKNICRTHYVSGTPQDISGSWLNKERSVPGTTWLFSSAVALVAVPTTPPPSLPRGCHQGSKSVPVTDFRKFPPEQEGRKEKESSPQWGGRDPKWDQLIPWWPPNGPQIQWGAALFFLPSLLLRGNFLKSVTVPLFDPRWHPRGIGGPYCLLCGTSVSNWDNLIDISSPPLKRQKSILLAQNPNLTKKVGGHKKLCKI